MNPIERLVRGIDRFQQDHVGIAFPFAVVRKFGDDGGARLAALLAYYGFFSLFPLLAVATTILGRVLANDPELRERLLDSALRTMPLIGPGMAGNLHAFDAGGLALAIAITVSVWSGLGAVKAFEHAMDTLWNVPERRRAGFVAANVRALGMLAVLASLTFVSAIAATSDLLGAGVAGTVAGWAAALMLNAVLFLAAFRVLCSTAVPWARLVPGAAIGAVIWTVLLQVGGLYVARQVAGANQIYGTFALVVGLLAWLYLGAMVALYAAEVNVVLAERLWPRSLVQPPLTAADRSVLIRYARQSERRPEVEVDVRDSR